jgi:hypothetical protein
MNQEIDKTKTRQAEFTRQHTLSPEQLKKMFEDKAARAVQYRLASQVQRQLHRS